MFAFLFFFLLRFYAGQLCASYSSGFSLSVSLSLSPRSSFPPPPAPVSVDRTMHYLSGIRSESNQPRRRIARARESIPREGNDFRKSQSLHRMCVLASVGSCMFRVAPRVIARNEGPDGKRRTREFPARYCSIDRLRITKHPRASRIIIHANKYYTRDARILRVYAAIRRFNGRAAKGEKR